MWRSENPPELEQADDAPVPPLGRATTQLVRSPVIVAVGFWAVVLVVGVSTLVATAEVTFEQLRVGLLGLAAIPVAVGWFGRRGSVVGPVGTGWLPRFVRSCGYLVVGAAVLGIVLHFRTATSNAGERAYTGVPILAFVVTASLVAVLAVTGQRSRLGSRDLATAGGVGVVSACVWALHVVVDPPLPPTSGWALVALATAVVLAGALTRGGEGDQRARRVLTALFAGTVSAWLILLFVVLASSYGPARWIPALVPTALTPADRISESRIEIQDPYVAVLFVGSLLAVGLVIAVIATRRPLPSEHSRLGMT